jgi:hypothetical protein
MADGIQGGCGASSWHCLGPIEALNGLGVSQSHYSGRRTGGACGVRLGYVRVVGVNLGSRVGLGGCLVGWLGHSQGETEDSSWVGR